MIKRMFMYLGLMSFLCGIALVSYATYDFMQPEDPNAVRYVDIPCDIAYGGAEVVVTVEMGDVPQTKEFMDELTKRVCERVVVQLHEQ